MRVPSPLHFAYLRTLSCSGLMRQADGKVTAKYCRARWCCVCNAIRSAKLMVAYSPELESWTDGTFLTLSRPNVRGKNLYGELRLNRKALQKVMAKARRGGWVFRAVLKVEVTYNPMKGTYHPHFHLMVDSRAVADELLRLWMAANPTAHRSGQDVRKCHSPLELFKYVTKLLVKGLEGEQTTPHPAVLDTIFRAMKNLRTMQPLGFRVAGAAVLPEDETLQLDASTLSPISRPEPFDWEWVDWLHDWVDKGTGEVLADFSPTLAQLKLLNRIRRDGLG